jgi:threonine/homoserine/homoserine lactone efflux protein
MLSLPRLATYCAAVLVVLVIPGPSVLYITARSASHGRRGGLACVLGVHTGSVAHIVAAGAGVSALLVASASAFSAVRIAGGAYLVWLGLRTLCRRMELTSHTATPVRSLRRLYLDGVVVNVFNPKVALFFLALFPQFVDPGRGPAWLQITVLGSIYVLLGLVSDGAYAFAATRIGRWLARRPSAARRSRRVEGTVLLALGVSTLAAPHSSRASMRSLG